MTREYVKLRNDKDFPAARVRNKNGPRAISAPADHPHRYFNSIILRTCTNEPVCRR